MERNTGTIFKIFLADKTKRGKQEGWIKLWKHKGKIVGHKPEYFDYLKEIPECVERILENHGIDWPPK